MAKLLAPGAERLRDSRSEPGRVREAERRVVLEAEARERRKVRVGIDAKEVVALAGYLAGKRLELFLLGRQA